MRAQQEHERAERRGNDLLHNERPCAGAQQDAGDAAGHSEALPDQRTPGQRAVTAVAREQALDGASRTD